MGVGTGKRSQNFHGRWGPAPWNGSVAEPQKHAPLPRFIMPNLVALGKMVRVYVVVVVEIFVHGAVKATVTNAPQSQLNKWVFSSFFNWPTVMSDWRSEAGRLFQSLGPATWKVRSPKPVWVRRTTQVEISDERSWRQPTSETNWKSSDN